MTPEQQQLIDKTRDSLKAARLLADESMLCAVLKKGQVSRSAIALV